MIIEEFRDIPDYEGVYQVSNLGRVKSLKFNKERILKSTKDRDGYLRVYLCLNNKSKTNKVENLEIVTQRENANKKHIKSSSKYIGVSWKKRDKKWVSSIRINGKKKYLGSFTDELEAHNAYQKALKIHEKTN